MARIVVKVKYLKPNAKRTPGRYARYIGTREGVDKIDDSVNCHEQKERESTYADYIATRPRAEKVGKHGLFTDGGVEVDLDKVSDDLNDFKGTIWTVIVSIKRDDAERLGFDSGTRWRNMVRANRDKLAKEFRIRPSDLRWYGAFHNESYHPHIHLIVYDKKNRGFLDTDGIEKLKSTFAHVIFQDEMLNIQSEETNIRDKLRLRGREEIEEIIRRINDGCENNTILQAMLIDLCKRLNEHKGKKIYGYLNKGDKYLVDRIVDQIEKIPAVNELYDIWYEKQEELRRLYSETVPIRVPLSENQEFKSIRNALIRAAEGIIEQPMGSYSFIDDDDIVGIDVTEDETLIRQNDKTKQFISYQEKQYNSLCFGRYSSSCVVTTISRLLDHVSKIFRDKFSDNPEHVSKVDVKLKRKIQEKEKAHGIKHG